VSGQSTRQERIQPRVQLEYEDPSDFDRIAFAMRALRVLRPKRMKIAVYPAVSALHVASGEEYGRGEGARWAMVGIPPRASREHIAYALVELCGSAAQIAGTPLSPLDYRRAPRSERPSVPYAVQLVLAADSRKEA
jgi:hypothetical protein